MSQVTVVSYATVGNSSGGGASAVAWTAPGNVTADDGVNASVNVTGTATDSQILGGEKFSLLSEDGGPIPVGATIIRITASIELLHTVTRSTIANASTRTWRLRRGTAGAAINEQFVAQNHNTNSGLIVVTATTGGTQTVPQTTFTRAELLNSEATNQLRAEIQVILPAAALNNATLAVDFMRVVVEWIKYEDRTGTAFSSGFATAIVKKQVTQVGKAAGTAASLGIPKAEVSKTGDVAGGLAFATGQQKTLVTMTGQSTTDATASGQQKPIFKMVGTSTTNAISSGVARAYSFAISGYTRDSTGVLLPNVRVDIYRKSDHNHMGRVTSDPTTAYYSLALPNTVEVFWCRFYLVGPPDLFDTTIDDLVLVESQTQGPS